MAITLNCDMGESFGVWTMGRDQDVMPLVDMASIACGFHASDPDIMDATVAMAVASGVTIGAHPSYADLAGFGRRSIAHTAGQIRTLLWYQLGALDGFCQAHGSTLGYVKPHGALNNDMMLDPSLLKTVMHGVRQFRPGLPLMVPVNRQWPEHEAMAREIGIRLIPEAFADRAYDEQGNLVSRREPGAVHHDTERIVAQAMGFARDRGVYSHEGTWLDLPAESLCVHGDNQAALDALRAIRQALGRPAS